MDTLLNIPWGDYKFINIHNSMISPYLSNARYTMDKVIYGQNERFLLLKSQNHI